MGLQRGLGRSRGDWLEACHINPDDGSLEEGGRPVSGEKGLDLGSVRKVEPEELPNGSDVGCWREEGEGKGDRDKRQREGTTLGSRHGLVGLENKLGERMAKQSHVDFATKLLAIEPVPQPLHTGQPRLCEPPPPPAATGRRA